MFALIIFKKRKKRDLKPFDVDIVSRFIFKVLFFRCYSLGHDFSATKIVIGS